MLPLFLVYISEYTINTSLYPLLLFPPPSEGRLSSGQFSGSHLGKLGGTASTSFSSSSYHHHHKRSLLHPITNLRSFYPTYSTLYQLGVFISRSSLPFYRLRRLYTGSILQLINFLLLLTEVMGGWLPSAGGTWVVLALAVWEGLLGGAVYVGTFARVGEEVGRPRRVSGRDEGEGSEGEDEPEVVGGQREGGIDEETEFALAAVSVSDSAGIMLAGVLGLWLEPSLCAWQVGSGRDACRRVEVNEF